MSKGVVEWVLKRLMDDGTTVAYTYWAKKKYAEAYAKKEGFVNYTIEKVVYPATPLVRTY